MAGSRSTASELTPVADGRRTGRARIGERIIPLTASAASRLSLHVELEGGARVEDGAVFDELEIDLDGGSARLGRCRFAADGGAAKDAVGDVVFLDDVYDCRSLIEEGKYTDLRNFFQNVPIVIAQREKIRADFKEHCSNLVYDLAVYKRFFDEQDAIIAGEPPTVAQAARDALIASEGRSFMAFLDAKIRELEDLVRDFTKEEHERHGFYLRRLIWPYILSSAFLRRTNLRPLGYAGDAEMMCMLYENRYVGASVFDQLLHKHPVESHAAQAVRNRRRIIPEVLREVRARFPDLPPHGLRFLSLASGPAWEVQDLFVEPEDFERYRWTLLDQDTHALAMAQEAIARVERERNGRIAVSFQNDSVRTMLRTRDMAQRFGRYHFIYSMGLFDYLTGPVARAVLARAFDLLLPGGALVVGNYHVRSRTRVYMDYWMDWPLYYRTEESLRELAEGLPAVNVRISSDATGCQMFLHLDRGP